MKILHNIHSSKVIPMNHGIQQQDPISPLEVLILKEFLSKDWECVVFKKIRQCESY